MPTGKEIYERRKRLKAERLLRGEEEQAYSARHQDEGDLLIAALVASMESIAASLEKIANK